MHCQQFLFLNETVLVPDGYLNVARMSKLRCLSKDIFIFHIQPSKDFGVTNTHG